MSKILFLSGSQRQNSFNSRLLQYIQKTLMGHCDLDTLHPAEIGLPIFDQDIEMETAVTQRVAALHQRFSSSDAIIVASPEYNGQLTPYLKNIIDWISRLAYINGSVDNPFQGRPLLLCSASTGWSGGAVGITHARALFGYVGCMVMGESICVPHAEQAWHDGTYMFEPNLDSHIEICASRLLQLSYDFSNARELMNAFG
jgi:NAD(P)H-dependent FMN reductase